MRWLLPAVFVPLLATGLACGGLFARPTVTATASDLGCGRVQVTVDTTGSGTVVATASGRELARLAVQGEMQQVFEADLAPAEAQVDVRFDGTSTVAVVPVALTPPALTIVPQTGTVGSPTRVQLDPACGAPQHYAVRALIDGEAVADVAVGNDRTALLPDLTLGEHAIRLSLVANGVVLGTDDLTVVREKAPPASPSEVGGDADGDGYSALDEGGTDCHDGDPAIHPGAAELPDGKDQDCDGVVDEGTTRFDDDGDGLSEDDGDCDDSDAGVHPGAAEAPDCRDQDCDGEIDEGVERVAVDDSLEPNDTREQALDLQTEGKRSFTRTLRFVTRDATDEEWIRFFSDDGPLDLWGIDVTGTSVGEGMAYDVEVYREGFGLRRNGPLGQGTGVSVGGQPFKSDTGHFVVRIRPTVVSRPWCPLEVRLHSG